MHGKADCLLIAELGGGGAEHWGASSERKNARISSPIIATMATTKQPLLLTDDCSPTMTGAE